MPTASSARTTPRLCAAERTAADGDGDLDPHRLLRRGPVTDGPFVETKEVLGGYYLIEAPDLDAALAIAKQTPARFGGVEVRPIMTFG